ncbi:winged helix-turn-helix domain-containing protein [Streptomyces sp. NBC_00076]|uniref:winged helix-turn-helix domain-containing protein n=1 Tax=Streptomyces sp. NBC_00076 TaxID=2975642 RepID=UPI00325380EB
MSDGNIGDGGGREFERVAGALRARMANGDYPLNSFLPAQRDLAKMFHVSRDTVQRVLKELQSEGWIDTRQGSGSRVIRVQRIHSPTSSSQPDRMVTLGPLVQRAFQEREVTLDVFTLTSESLDAHIRLQVERMIRGEQAPPQRIAIRMLLPLETLEIPYWRTDDGVHDELLKERYLAITRQHTASLRSMLSDLKVRKLVPSVHFDIRRVRLVPPFKVYLVNQAEALHGLYEVFKRGIVLEDDREIEAIDVVGLGARLTHHVKDADPYSQGTVFVETMQAWFDSAWEFLTENPRPKPAGS